MGKDAVRLPQTMRPSSKYRTASLTSEPISMMTGMESRIAKTTPNTFRPVLGLLFAGMMVLLVYCLLTWALLLLLLLFVLCLCLFCFFMFLFYLELLMYKS